MVVYVMLTGCYPYDMSGTVWQLYKEIEEKRYKKPENLPCESCERVIEQMLTYSALALIVGYCLNISSKGVRLYDFSAT